MCVLWCLNRKSVSLDGHHIFFFAPIGSKFFSVVVCVVQSLEKKATLFFPSYICGVHTQGPLSLVGQVGGMCNSTHTPHRSSLGRIENVYRLTVTLLGDFLYSIPLPFSLCPSFSCLFGAPSGFFLVFPLYDATIPLNAKERQKK